MDMMDLIEHMGRPGKGRNGMKGKGKSKGVKGNRKEGAGDSGKAGWWNSEAAGGGGDGGNDGGGDGGGVELDDLTDLQRRRPRLMPQQWNVQVFEAHELGRAGGVAMVYEAETAETLRRVGATLRPTAILTTRPLSEMGFRGYMTRIVTFDMQVFDETKAGEGGMLGMWREHLGVRRYLTQVGRGAEQVERVVAATARVIAEHRAMTRVVVDIDRTAFEWAMDTTITGMHVTGIVASAGGVGIDIHDVVVREDGTATVRIPTGKVDNMLAASGRNGAYFKAAFDEGAGVLDFVLWLEPGLSHEEAMDVCDALGSVGLMRRGKRAVRYGVRWKTQDDYDKAVTMIPGKTHLAGTTRYKVVPVIPEVGVVGLQQMLKDLGWEVVEMVYTDKDAALGQVLVYAAAVPPVGQFSVRGAGGVYEVYIRAVGKASQVKMDRAGIGNTPSGQGGSMGTDAAKTRGTAALARTQNTTRQRHQVRRENPGRGQTPEGKRPSPPRGDIEMPGIGVASGGGAPG